MPLNITLFIELVEFYQTKITTIIIRQNLNFSTSVFFNKGLKNLKLTKDFGFTLEIIN